MILRYEHGKLVEQRTYRKALQLEGDVSPVISIVGAGGKTTTIHKIAEEYVESSIPVVVTTTTHMMIEEEPYFLLEDDLMVMTGCFILEEFRRQILHKLEKYGQVWIGKRTNERKMGQPSKEVFQMLKELSVTLLIEADGARRLPCKAPGEREPVLVEETTMLIALYGLDAIGKTIQECCFRSELVANILEKKVTDILEPKDIALLAMDKQGGKKGLSKQQRYVVVLNKADNEKLRKDALCICERIAEIEHENTDKRSRGSGNRNCHSLVSMWT